MLKDSLDGGLFGGDLSSPGDGDAREGLWNEKTVPGAKLPRAVGVGVEGANGGVDELGQLGDAGLGDHCRAARAVGGDAAVVAAQVGALEVAQADGAVAGAGAADGDEAETLDSAGDEFSVEALADEDGDAVVAEAPGASEQAAVPEGVNGWRSGVVAGDGTGVTDIAIAEGHAEAADGHVRETGNDREDETLLQGVGVSHG